MIPWLKVGGTEIANSTRTLEYIRLGLTDSRVRAPRDAGGCDCSAIDDGTYFNPETDPAPWFTSGVVASRDFLGFLPSRMELSPAWTRPVIPRQGDGSLLGRLRLGGRVLQVEGVLIANSDLSMEYGRHWLTDALGGSRCAVLDDVCFLPACPEGEGGSGYQDEYEDIYEGDSEEFRHFRNAGIVDGPNFLPIDGVPECFMLQVNFQIASEQGYIYAPPETCMDQVLDGSECCTFSTDEWPGDATLIIEIEAGGPNYLEDVTISLYPLKAGDGTCPPSSNPCNEVTISSLRPGSKLVIDGTKRSVEVIETASTRVIGGLDALSLTAPFEFFDVGPCSRNCICVDGTGGSLNANSRVKVEVVKRET